MGDRIGGGRKRKKISQKKKLGMYLYTLCSYLGLVHMRISYRQLTAS